MSKRQQKKNQKTPSRPMAPRWLVGGAAALAAVLGGYGAIQAAGADAAQPAMVTAAAVQDGSTVTLYKNPTCSCCAAWAEHMRENGFQVDVEEGADLAQVRNELNVPFDLGSCHTAVVGDYALEGHVPADVVRQLLEEQPGVAGLAVPGMPRGVPGMPGAGLASFDVLAFQDDGTSKVYATR